MEEIETAIIAKLPKTCVPLMIARTGSHAYNLALPTSDADYKGVYTYPSEFFLGLETVKESIDGSSPTDYQFHELGKYCQLLLKGNPNSIELLFLRDYILLSKPFEELRSMRKFFLSRTLVRSYLGYAYSQLSLLEKGRYLHTTGGEYGEKWAYHLIRLLKEGHRIAKGMEPRVWYPNDDPDHELLMDIRLGHKSQSWVIDTAKELMDQIRSSEAQGLVPDNVDFETVNTWLKKTRLL